MPKVNRVINAVLGEPWAATSETIEKVWMAVNRAGDLEALRSKMDASMKNTRHTQIRNGVAIISIVGPLIRYAGVMSDISGATSYESIARDLNEAMSNPQVSSVVLEINSGGGSVTSVVELVSLLQQNTLNRKTYVRGKEIIAYVDGQCCSAAYWLASACSKIYASQTAIVGSIGVQMIADTDEKTNEIKFLSSHSPNKNASPSSKEGKEECQRIVDDLGEVFVGSVAQNRGISKQEVLEKYGQGSVFVAAEALERGLIDEITTMEELLGEIMDDLNAKSIEEKYPDAHKEIFNAGASSLDIEAIKRKTVHDERCRIIEILDLKGSETLTRKLIDEGSSVGAAAIAFRKEEIAIGKSKLNAMEQADEQLNAPNQGSFTASAKSPEQEAFDDVKAMQQKGIL